MDFLSFLWRRHRIALIALALALTAAIWFAGSFVREAMYFANPAHQRQTLEGWMSPRYVGKSWDLPPEIIIRIMELEPGSGRRSLARVTADLGITLSELEARVRAARVALDAERAGPGQ